MLDLSSRMMHSQEVVRETKQQGDKKMAACKDCGKRCKGYIGYCKTCESKRTLNRTEQAIKIVNADCCPQCGSKIKRNLALNGWYQCEQFGTGGFRKDINKPACSWQIFTV